MRLIADDPGLPGRLTRRRGRHDRDRAAEGGDARAVEVMLDAGLPIDAHNDGHGATALHVAAYSGSVETVTLLLSRGADIEARDATFNGNALDWAVVGSGEQPSRAPDPDWEEVVRILLDGGSSTDGLSWPPASPASRAPRSRACCANEESSAGRSPFSEGQPSGRHRTEFAPWRSSAVRGFVFLSW